MGSTEVVGVVGPVVLSVAESDVASVGCVGSADPKSAGLQAEKGNAQTTLKTKAAPRHRSVDVSMLGSWIRQVCLIPMLRAQRRRHRPRQRGGAAESPSRYGDGTSDFFVNHFNEFGEIVTFAIFGTPQLF
jgi:hypothetical protein